MKKRAQRRERGKAQTRAILTLRAMTQAQEIIINGLRREIHSAKSAGFEQFLRANFAQEKYPEQMLRAMLDEMTNTLAQSYGKKVGELLSAHNRAFRNQVEIGKDLLSLAVSGADISTWDKYSVHRITFTIPALQRTVQLGPF